MYKDLLIINFSGKNNLAFIAGGIYIPLGFIMAGIDYQNIVDVFQTGQLNSGV